MLVEDELTRAAELELQQHQITGELGLSPQLYEDEEEDAAIPGEAGPGTSPSSPPTTKPPTTKPASKPPSPRVP